ncbi:MAG: ion transporter [Erysipelotrichaceae bacterium]|nr:ion transporter [Erysipelotrichaceae bacterium]
MKQKIFKIINVDDDHYLPSKLFDIIIVILIILSMISVILSTFNNIPSWITNLMSKFESISIVIFTIEYLLRIWSADLLYPNNGKIKSRIKYIFSFMALIDLIAILPFYLPFITNVDLRSLRLLRLFRMARIFKINRYTTALNSVSNVLIKKKDQLISSLSVVFILMLIASILMYYCEHDAQPDVFDNAFSGFWWAIATLTTVGYGDI